MLLVGFAIAVPLALSMAGGWQAVTAAAPGPEYLDIFSSSGIVYIALIVPAFIISPGLLQKAYACRDERALRIGIAAQGFVLLLFAFTPALLGMIARVYEPALANPEFAVPTVLTLGLPTLFGALALAAVFSAEVSSADTILFMLSTSLSKDIYKRYVAPEASDAQVLKAARLAALAGGALGILLVFVIPTVIGSLTIFYSVMSVSLFVPIVVGLHTRRAGVPEALAAIGVGSLGTDHRRTCEADRHRRLARFALVRPNAAGNSRVGRGVRDRTAHPPAQLASSTLMSSMFSLDVNLDAAVESCASKVQAPSSSLSISRAYRPYRAAPLSLARWHSARCAASVLAGSPRQALRGASCRARPYEKLSCHGASVARAFIALNRSVACSEVCPPERKTIPGTAAGTEFSRQRTVRSATTSTAA